MGSVDAYDMELLVFAAGAVVGGHRPMTALPQGYSFVVASGDDVENCIVESIGRDDYEVEVGDGSYLVTAIAQCLGLSVRPGCRVALVRVYQYGSSSVAYRQSSIVYHQAGPGSPVPPDATNTAVVSGWQGSGWAGPLRLLRDPGDAHRTDWPINVGLRALGVQRGDYPDEIAALGLPITIPLGPVTA